MDLCLGMDCIVSKLVRRGKIWDVDNGMSFDTGKGGRNCKKREALWMSHKPSFLEQPRDVDNECLGYETMDTLTLGQDCSDLGFSKCLLCLNS